MTKSSSHLSETFSLQTQKQIEGILSKVGTFETEVSEILDSLRPSKPKGTAGQKIESVFFNFHKVAIQLHKRQRGKSPFEIEDEYDVQDLLHGLLKLYFDDIEPEEYCPSYCGVSSRIDFFLRDENIFIEAKIASKTHRRRRIAEELILDKEYYSKKEGLKGLFCLVYDPNCVIDNPRGFEKDLNEEDSVPEIRVYVVPRL
jgi:hypothetical protein